MNWKYFVARFKEASTWRGLIAVATASGLAIEPEMGEAIITVGLFLMGGVGIATKDK